MNTLTISLKNIRKNLSFYALYLFSAAFVITVFFAFLSFSMDDIIVEKISSDGRVESMCRTISIFLMAFVIFYMTYSNRFFLRRRTEELGIYALLDTEGLPSLLSCAVKMSFSAPELCFSDSFSDPAFIVELFSP